MATSKKIVKGKKAVAKPVKSVKTKGSKPVEKKKTAKPVQKVAAKKPAAKKTSVKKPVAVKAVKAKVVKKTLPPAKVTKPVASKVVEKKAAPKSSFINPVATKPPVNRNNVAAHSIDKSAKGKPVAPAQKPVAPKKVEQKPAALILPQRPRPTMPVPPHKTVPVKAAVLPVQRNSNGTEKTRYSDSELKEFKVLIVNKLNDARIELINLNAAIISANENGTDDTGASFKMLEDGSDTLAKEEAAQLAARQKKFIEQLEAALVRIENQTYGICRVTGKLIPKERLRAVPHTTQSMEAKLQQYKD